MRSSILLLSALFGAVIGLTSCAQKAMPTRSYPLGEKVAAGHLIYSAYETQWLTQIGTPPDARVPQTRFLLVRVSITNSGGAPIASPNLSVVDDAGNAYAELSDGQGVPQWIGYIRQINQADTMQGNLIFDVPPKHYKLRVADENNEHEAMIDLPLEFTPDTPDLVPQQKSDAPARVDSKDLNPTTKR